MTVKKNVKPEAGSAIIKSDEAADIVLFDRRSPANRAGHYEESWKLAWAPAREQANPHYDDRDLDRAGERYNQYWGFRQADEELMAWKACCGVYRVDVRLLPDEPKKVFAKEQRQAFLGGQDVERTLQCQSGELVVAPLNELGTDAEMVLSVPPGVYRVGMDADSTQHSKHWGLKNLSDYPAAEGPDFVIYLQKTSKK